jgi:hypothetical protein
VAKLRVFVHQQLRLTVAPAATAGAEITVVVRVNASSTVQATSLRLGTGDAAFDAQVTARLRTIAERHPRVETLTSGEASALADRDVVVVVRVRP